MKKTMATLLGVLALSGCASMIKSDPGSLEGLEFAGYPGKATEDDFAVAVNTFSVKFLVWHLASGSIEWVPEKETVKGTMSLTDHCRQDKFMELMEKLAQHYNADVIQYEFDDYEPFNVGTAPTEWINVPFWLAYWFFPTHEVGCSAIMRRRPRRYGEVEQ